MIISYYDYSADDEKRIAAVHWCSEKDQDNRFGAEISPDSLPDDFKLWEIYAKFCHSDCMVEIKSREGM